jgi:hypothetical protein
MVGLAETDFVRNPFTREGIDLKNSYKENIYGFELLPFLHYDLPDGGFFRIGTSISLFKKKYSYCEIWGGQEVYSPGWTDFGWEMDWERSSYGDVFTLTNFSEANLELVLSTKSMLVLTIDLWSHIAHRRTKRTYGDNILDEAGVFNFHQQAQRTNILKEFWIGGTFGFQIGRKISLGLFADLPIHYDNSIRTEISGEGGEYFKGFSNSQPAIRRPIRFRALLVINW